MGNTTTNSRLTISTLTWLRFSYNLFDYESNDYSRTNLKVDCEGYLIRKGIDIHFVPECKEDDEVLLRVEMGKSGKYLVDRAQRTGRKLDVMRVVKPQEEILVTENSLVKIGRVELRIKKLELNTFLDVGPIIQHCGKAGSGNECRFCFNQQNEITNPLLSPCDCKGSLKYIHLDCLRTWLKTRMLREEEGGILHLCWENLKCQLCGNNIQSQIDLFSLEESQEPCIVIETIQQEEQERKVSIFIIPMEKNREKEITIGRAKGNDIRINDISVSRHHCRLFVREGRGYIQDNGSKFGTLIRIERQIGIEREDEVWLQSGRTLIKAAKEDEQ